MAGRADELLEAARQYVRMGASVIPMGNDKRPDFRALRASGSLNWIGLPSWLIFTRRQPSDTELQSWCASGETNMGIITSFNGVFVLDFDLPEAFQKWWERHPQHHQTWVTRTHRGYHVYFRHARPTHMSKFHYDGQLAGDFIGGPRWIVSAPSQHPMGSCYRWMNQRSPWDLPIRVIHDLAELNVIQKTYRTVWKRASAFGRWFRHHPRKATRRFILNRLTPLGR
jgi:hypothetical protein